MEVNHFFLWCLCLSFLACHPEGGVQAAHYPEQSTMLVDTTYTLDTSGYTIQDRFPVPEGFHRVAYPENSFAHYLRTLPLQPSDAPVMLYNGALKRNQAAASAVLAIDIGTRDLQQCADAVIRLRAEYLWQQKAYNAIQFHFTNGFLANYSNWRSGQRIRVNGNEVNWTSSRGVDTSYAAFRSYLNMVFAYAGTLSVAKELQPQSIANLQVGDVFIQGGSPGHAVIVVDMVVDPTTGARMILLAQSYMPAQNIHVLSNPGADTPWYAVDQLEENISTPEWRFKGSDLRRF